MVSVVLTLTSTGTPSSFMSPGLTILKSLPCFHGDSRDAHLSDLLFLTLITSSSFVFVPQESFTKTWWKSRMQFIKLQNNSSAKNTVEKVFSQSDNRYSCVWTVFILRRAHRVPQPASLQMGSHTKKFDVIIIVSSFISPHD